MIDTVEKKCETKNKKFLSKFILIENMIWWAIYMFSCFLMVFLIPIHHILIYRYLFYLAYVIISLICANKLSKFIMKKFLNKTGEKYEN